jgi:anti-anti-sigma regulatory factor
VSPQVARILRQSGKDFSSILEDEEELDRYYDSL